MKRTTLCKIYAISLTVVFLLGEALLFCLPVFSGIDAWIELLIGLVVALIVAPTIHEIGHLSFARASKMKPILVKCFCLKIQRIGSRYAFSLANPFAPDQTQVLPVQSGDMENRAKRYVLGGLIYGGIWFFTILLFALVLSFFDVYSAILWGIAPYSGYLFLLNVAPFEYPSGKTDALVYQGICKDEPTEKAFIMAMEVQGLAYEGTPYAEMDDEKFDFPILAEDEPIFALCNHLKYRLALDKADFDGAADALNRLAQSESYLSDFERENLAAELTYMHALSGNLSAANETAKFCEEYLRGENLVAKRVLATVAWVAQKTEETENLKEQAKKLLEKEEIKAERLLEEKLLAKLSVE
jgi:hypothetical protein